MIIVINIVVAVIVVVVAIVVFIVMGRGCVDVGDVVKPVVTMDTWNQPQPHDLLRVGSNDLKKKNFKLFKATLNKSHGLWLISHLPCDCQHHNINHNNNNNNDSSDRNNLNNDHNYHTNWW